MRILIVDELCYPQLGGQQVRFKELAEEWVKAGHSVVITAIDHLGNLEKEEVINGVVYKRLLSDASYYKNGMFGRKISSIFRYSNRLKPVFRERWDLIIFNQFPMIPQLYYKWFVKDKTKTILDFVEHRSSKMWKIINNSIINAADKVICISNHVKSCAALYRPDNLFVIPSLVNTHGSISRSKGNYLFLGRLENHKHPDHAIEAVKKYNELYSQQMIIDVVGSGDMFDELSAKYNEDKAVIFHGSVDNEQKSDVLSNARLLILPSEREGLPKVVIEAMSFGVPSLTTDYPGNGTQFFVKEEGVGLVANPSIEDLAAKINDLEGDYQSYVNKCNAIRLNYDLNENSKKYLKIAGL